MAAALPQSMYRDPAKALEDREVTEAKHKYGCNVCCFRPTDDCKRCRLRESPRPKFCHEWSVDVDRLEELLGG